MTAGAAFLGDRQLFVVELPVQKRRELSFGTAGPIEKLMVGN